MTERDIAILGLGNVLCSDDGVGVAAIHRLIEAHEPAPGVEFVDGGTLGLSLLDYFDRDVDLIVLDAVRTDAPPGTLVRFEGDDVEPAAAAQLSVHQVGVADLLAAARWLDRLPSRVILLGVVPETLALGSDRTAAVEAAIPALVAAVEAELETRGRPLGPRRSARPAQDITRALGL